MTKLKNSLTEQKKLTPKAKGKWDKVNALWKKIEKKQATLLACENERKSFYQTAESKIGEVEREYTLCVKSCIEQLLKFIPYKSLSEYQFEVLSQWLDTMYNQITNNPFNVGDQAIGIKEMLDKQNWLIKERFKKINPHADIEFEPGSDRNAEVNNVIKMLEIVIEDNCDEVPAFTKRQWLAIVFNPARLDDIFDDPFFEVIDETVNERNDRGTFDFSEEDFELAAQDLRSREAENYAFEQMFESDFEESDQFDFNFSFNFDENDAEATDTAPEVNKLLKNDEINKIYRQLAHIFHPDKITDDSKKQLYSELMQKLSVAKKNRDIYVIIEMAIEYLPNFDLELSDETYDGIISSLEKKLMDVEYEILQSDDDSVEMLVWRRFYRKNSKQSDAEFDKHIKYIKEKIEGLQQIIFAEKMTVKKLGAILKHVERELMI